MGDGEPAKIAAGQRYLMLDALRGIAAICVMLWHRRDWFDRAVFLPHAYLAVDFFFLLSGFVLAQAYGRQLGRSMGFGQFMRRRAERLLPLVVLGVVLGAVMMIGAAATGRAPLPAHFPAVVAVSFLTIPVFWHDVLWPVDPPLWSIFFELVANAAFALVGARMSNRLLVAVVAVSAVVLLVTVAGKGGFGGGPIRRTFLLGFPRIGFSFCLGVLLYRLDLHGMTRHWRFGGWAPLVLVASFMLPKAVPYHAPYDAFVVMLVYPVVLLAGANAVPRWRRGAQLSGDLSYPLYTLHEPLLLGVAAAAAVLGVGGHGVGAVEAAARFAVVVAVSWLALRLFDEPIRRALARRRQPPRYASSSLSQYR